jgi:hypothetical protein
LQPATTISIAIAEWHPEALIQRAEALDDDKLKEKEALTQQAAPSVREVCESPPFEETTHEVFEFFLFLYSVSGVNFNQIVGDIHRPMRC